MAEQKTSSKVKKKQWLPIVAPKLFSEQVIGETIAGEPNEVVGRGVSYNLMNLTGDIKRQNTNIKFEIESVENNRAKAKVVGYEIAPSSIRRMVRRNNIKMDMSFAAKTSDDKTMRIKPLLLTKNDTKRSIGSKIRKLTQDFIIKNVQKMQFDDVMNDIISHKMQSSLRDALKKVYPLRTCEIRYAAIQKASQREEKTV